MATPPKPNKPANATQAKGKNASGAKQGPIGNTTGLFIPQVKPNLGGAPERIPIVAEGQEEKGFLEKKQQELQSKIDGWVEAQGENRAAMAAGALATALNQVLFPTSLWELIPVGKGFKLAKKGKEAIADLRKAEKAAEEAKKAQKAKQAEKAAEKEAKDAKKAGENNGGRVDPKKQKPHKDCGKVSKYSKAPKKLGEINADHVPSGAALKKAAEQQLERLGILSDLSPKELKSILNAVYNNATTISIPEDVHKEGRTWGSKNKPHVDGDAANLKEAFKKDTDAIQKSMDTKDHGCSDKYREAVEQMEKIDFDKEIEKVIRDHKAAIKYL